MKLDKPELLTLGLFTIKLLLYSDTHDAYQKETKKRNWIETVEYVADLQVPLMTNCSYEDSFNSLAMKSDEIKILDRFLKSISEDSKERTAMDYYATNYEDVLKYYRGIVIGDFLKSL